jgi:acetyl-CoA carboxylase carboxyl transferase subunit alpha
MLFDICGVAGNTKKTAAEALKLTAENMFSFGLVDGIIKEPTGGAHTAPEEMAKILKKYLKKELADLSELTPETRIEQRIKKFSSMGKFEKISANKLEKIAIPENKS